MNGSTRFPLSLRTTQRNDCQGNGLGANFEGKEDPVELDSSLELLIGSCGCRIGGSRKAQVKYHHPRRRLTYLLEGGVEAVGGGFGRFYPSGEGVRSLVAVLNFWNWKRGIGVPRTQCAGGVPVFAKGGAGRTVPKSLVARKGCWRAVAGAGASNRPGPRHLTLDP